MKTPHRVTLIYGETYEAFNPETGEYGPAGNTAEVVQPCLVTALSEARQFELYGERQQKVLTVRFSQAVEPFDRLVYQDELYKPIDTIDMLVKSAVRVRRVSDQ